MLSFEQAIAAVEERLRSARFAPPHESVVLHQARGRILAESLTADRDYPPFDRSTRDGFAVRAKETASVPITLRLAGEVRAGQHFKPPVEAGCCVQILTGAPLPAGTDAVVMVEHTRVGDDRVEVLRTVVPFENVVRRGSEAVAGSAVLSPGRRLGTGEIGLLASMGKASASVYAQPTVAILPTGDEIIPVSRAPQWYQIRNSNSAMLAAQVASAGAEPQELPIAPDDEEALQRLVLEGLRADLVLLSGGVSKGKYDFVNRIMQDLGAEFYFRGVAIRPGKPLVFGRVQNRFFFGLPGNPVSGFVTFELFVRPALAVLGGGNFDPPAFLRARLGSAVRHGSGLTTFMPARIETCNGQPVVNLVAWQGSGDLVGVAESNCFLVIHPEQERPQTGDWVDVLPRLT